MAKLRRITVFRPVDHTAPRLTDSRFPRSARPVTSCSSPRDTPLELRRCGPIGSAAVRQRAGLLGLQEPQPLRLALDQCRVDAADALVDVGVGHGIVIPAPDAGLADEASFLAAGSRRTPPASFPEYHLVSCPCANKRRRQGVPRGLGTRTF
jgi:hypothetical protein